MVDTIVPCLTGQLFITIVILEQTDWLTVAYPYHNLALFTIFAWRTVCTQQVDVVLRVGDSHGTWLGSHPREGSQCHGGFCLSEAFHHLDTCLLLELVEHSGVQCLAGRGTILQ